MPKIGYLTLTCADCGWQITSDHRSGNLKYLLDVEMRERWNRGIEDDMEADSL